MSPTDDLTSLPADRCAACGHPLAHDQRYCLRCGTRRGPLPAQVSVALRMLADRDAAGAVTEEPAEEPPGDGVDILPVARAAAVSILLMLGVGSVVGATTAQGGVGSLAHTIVVAFHGQSPAPVAPTPIASTGGGSAAAGSGSGSSSGSSGGGGSGSGSPSRSPAKGGTGNASGSTGSTGSTGTGSTGSGNTGNTGNTGSGNTGSGNTGPASALPPIGHVWEIVLSGQGYAQSFGDPAADPYLAKRLVDQGELINQYDAVATSPLANEVALISGQGPTVQTLADCPQYTDIAPGTTRPNGQVIGSGCLYPASTQTLGRQLQIAGLQWRAYIQGVGTHEQRHPPKTTTTTGTTGAGTTTTTTTTGTTTTGTTGTATTGGAGNDPAVVDTNARPACPHPAEGTTDAALATRGRDDYVTWKNPWMYFHSALQTACAHHDVGLPALTRNLRHVRTTPAFSYIAPDPCDDGSDTPCRPGAKGGLKRADAFLKMVVPQIERSPAYKADGLILITFDEAPQSGPNWSTASCCGQPTFPNIPGTSTTSSTGTTSTSTTTTTTTTASSGTTGTATAPEITGDPPGGGQVGLLMISPYVAPKQLNTIETYNHFSLLKSIENLFKLPHLGYAAGAQVPAFVPSLFTAAKR